MQDLQPFTFERSKGIVWVCDLAESSSYLNTNISAEDIENFIPRFYYVSKLIVEAYGGEFLKWTGDGFLCFFEFELDTKRRSS
jgi:class 3 adenylate cyclase